MRLAVLCVVGLLLSCSVSRGESHALGEPWRGALVDGVQLPASGKYFFTWDPILRRAPDRAWRRFGTERLVRLVVRVIDAYASAHPHAPRVGIGDLSRPRGGDFGVRFGWPGHVSHQNGLDVDVYYPRVDRRERPPDSPAQIDHPLAQDLVNRFVRAGEVRILVGQNTKLTGPARVVQVLANHDTHLHLRLGPAPPHWQLLGRSEQGRPIRVAERGNPHATRVLVIGCIHGTECAGRAVVRLLVRTPEPLHTDLWLVDNLNPDGFAAGSRTNGDGVDLNRNFPSHWRPRGHRGDPEYSGPRPLSERETRIAWRLIVRLRPAVTIWFHQPQGIVRAWGHSVAAAERFARLAHVSFRRLGWPTGSATNWQNNRFQNASSFVVELPPGPLTLAQATRYARAVIDDR
jgi:hypothetical protein